MSIHPLDARAIAQAEEDIAAQFSRPLSEVQQILNSHVYRLDGQARIKQYVPLLAIKKVKDMLRRNRHTGHSKARIAA